MTENKENNFFVSAPMPLKLAFIGASLSIPVQYKKDKITGLDNFFAFVSTKRGIQPINGTLGIENSVAKGEYNAFLHQLGLDELLKAKSDTESVKILADKLYKNIGYKMRKGNGFQQTILEPHFRELSEKVADIYPSFNLSYENIRDKFSESVTEMFAVNRKSLNENSK